MSKKKAVQSIGSFTIVMLLVVGSGLYLFYQFMYSAQTSSQEEKSPTTEVEMLLNKDLDEGYPAYPTQVVALFCRISKALYGQELSDSQFEGLIEKQRQLYAVSLAAENTVGEMKTSFTKEIQQYKQIKQVVLAYQVEKEEQVKYTSLNQNDYASLYAGFQLRNKTMVGIQTSSGFLLVKENSNWKILGFQQESSPDKNKKEAVKGE